MNKSEEIVRDCPFCSIDKEITRVIETTKNCFVFFSNPRLMPGHLLISPKRHIVRPSELIAEERKEIFDLIIKYQEKLVANIASGCDIRQNYRPFQKQTKLKIHHLHFHLQPREFKDEIYEKSQIYETDLFQPLEDEEVNTLKKKLNISG